MSRRSYFMFVLFALVASFSGLAQKGFAQEENITFKMRGFNSSYQLVLCPDNSFVFNYSWASCLASLNECGELVTFGDNETIDGAFCLDQYELTFMPYLEEEIFLKDSFLILPLEDSTYLIWATDNELQNIADWRDHFDQKFPVYLERMGKSGMFSFYHSDQNFELDAVSKERVFELFR